MSTQIHMKLDFSNKNKSSKFLPEGKDRRRVSETQPFKNKCSGLERSVLKWKREKKTPEEGVNIKIQTPVSVSFEMPREKP